MVHALVFVSIKPGMLEEALAVYRHFVPQVKANEPGCLEYLPIVDCDAGLTNQEKAPNMIIVIERWKTMADFKAHVEGPPHVAAFRSTIKQYLEKISMKVMEDAI